MVDWKLGEQFLSDCDPILNKLIREYGPCDLAPLDESQYFTTLIKGIISQQLSQQVAAGIYAKVREFYGGHIPSAEQVCETSVQDFRLLGLAAQKASYILDLSSHITAGKVRPELFTAMSDDEILEVLLPVKGFGRWTVEMFLIFALNRTNVWPIDDFGIKKAMNMLYGVDMKAKRTVYNELAAKWEPWRTLAAWYLWKYYSANK